MSPLRARPDHVETNPTQAIPTDTSRAWRDALLLAVLLAVFFGFELGGRALWHPDEGRYSEIPRAMVASGDYVTPRLNGVKYFEKPALFYWMQAGSIKLFGVNEWALRLWPALLALAGCLAVYGAGRKLFGRRAGLIAAIVLATSPLYYLLARIITLDMAVSVLLTGALLSFLLGVREPPGRTRSLYLYAFYALCAAATLTKGLIGIVIPAMVIGAWIVLLWDWRLLRAIHLPTGLLLFFVLAAPWHVLAARANPEFAQFYFIHEHFQRYLTTGTWALPAVVVLHAGAGARRAAVDRAGFPALRAAWPGWRARREHPRGNFPAAVDRAGIRVFLGLGARNSSPISCPCCRHWRCCSAVIWHRQNLRRNPKACAATPGCFWWLPPRWARTWPWSFRVVPKRRQTYCAWVAART